MDEQLQTLAYAKKTAIELAIQFGPKLLVAFLILVAGYYVGRWVGRLANSIIKLALTAIQDLLCAHPRILQEPEPVTRVLALADFNAALSDITQAVLESFRARGITIPLPQRDVRLLGQS